MNAQERIIVALDVSSLGEAEPLVKELAPYVGCFKAGLQLLTSVGAPKVVEFLSGLGGKVFLDGKFGDIPNTMGEAAQAAASLGVAMFNVHASAGIEAMMAAVQHKGNSQVLAVTVLTSLEENNAYLIFGAPSKAKVLQFARDARIAGVDGVICSPQELELLGKQKELTGLLKVTPGDAIAAGATALVIGRPITKPPKEVGKPADAARRIAEEIAIALERRG